MSVYRKSSCQCLKMPPCSQNCENCILNFNHGLCKITVFSPTFWTVFLNKPAGSSNISNQSETQLIRKDFHRGLTNSHMCLIGQTVVGIFRNVEHNVRIYSRYLEMSNTMLEFILTICFQISWIFFKPPLIDFTINVYIYVPGRILTRYILTFRSITDLNDTKYRE